jgi:polyhydroxyalkanoate synthesis regulator phasin
MSTNLKPKLIAGAVAGIAVAGGGAAVAATQFGSPRQESQAVVDDAAAQLGIKPSALTAALKKALENRIDAAVAAGRLTKEQGNELKQRLESGGVPLFPVAPGPLGRGFFHVGPFGGLDAAASYLGLTRSEVEMRLRNGNTLAAIAKAEGKSVSGLVDAMYDAAKKHLDADVSAGRLTEDEESRILDGLKARLTDFVNGEARRFGPRLEGGHRDFDGPPPPRSGSAPGI